MTHNNYGNVKILELLPTNRGGLALIEVSVPANAKFPKKSTFSFWVRAGDVLPGS